MSCDLIFRNAQTEDAKRIWDIYEEAKTLGKINGTNDWTNDYPNKNLIQQDIIDQKMIVAMYGCDIVGCVSWTDHDDLDNELLNWKDNKSMVVLRLCVSVQCQGMGIGNKIMDELENLARNMGYCSIRLLASLKNPAANALYNKMNYNFKGKTNLYDCEFNAYERCLTTALT